jgi:hypothetical protein
MVKNDYTRTAIIGEEEELFINWAEEEKLLENPDCHFDNRTLVLDHGLYVIRERQV